MRTTVALLLAWVMLVGISTPRAFADEAAEDEPKRHVFVYPTTEREPLERAKKEIFKCS
ncbi:MAG: hypothetical protein IH912_09315 [Proteobacteria bacterium]|nr:hypothetical protein [Pseudomonadota bacterium]